MLNPPLRRALISVSDKTGLAEFARALAAAGVELFSTGGTRRHLADEGLAVRDVAAYTGFPEMMDGRLKTLHPKVFGGILCRRDAPEDMQALDEHGIVPFELVVVNLYPFEATIAKIGVTPGEAIEKIDIGGPSLVRAAAKNHAFVAVATDARQYGAILAEINAAGATSPSLRRRLAAEAFAHTAGYDRAIAAWFSRYEAGDQSAPAAHFPRQLQLQLDLKETLRYGENPHQQAALYAETVDGAATGARAANLLSARRLHGKELSYNNLLDLDSALAIVRGFTEPAAVVIKHNNPCGAAMADVLADATREALDGDPLSAFGSVLGFNRPLDLASAEVLAEPGRFVEAIVAPGFEPAALDVLTSKPKWKANVRLLELGAIGPADSRYELRQLDGGFLCQQADVLADERTQWKVVTRQAPTDAQWASLEFAWAIVRFVKSNAIVLANGRALVGVGAGQMSRVDSTRIAVEKAGPRASGAVLASDAFFPFADSIHAAAAAGVSAIAQPGGSRNDDEVIAACNEHGLAMVFTGKRHFKH
jgi:phosphoribosylaminoimidazolecarboxamide formyltransferase / IMP cyclohydrolase